MTKGLQCPAPADSAYRADMRSMAPVATCGAFSTMSSGAPYDEAAAYGQMCLPGVQRAAVLVVDDEPAITALLAEVLDIAGYDTLTAADGRTALAIARRERPALVLTDRLMPEVDGIEFVRRLRASPVTNNIPVVLMSSTRPTQDQLADIPFLPKPFDLDEVLSVIAKYASYASSASDAG